MLTRTERERAPRGADRTSIFDSKAWEARKAAIAARVARKQGATHSRAIARRQDAAGKPSLITRAKRSIRAAIDRRQKARHSRTVAYARKMERQTTQSV
jgi:hypothetical protein